MSVLIKGMKMPKSSRDCPFTEMDENWEKQCTVNGKYEWHKDRLCDNCPLIELQPHGNLIDKLELCHALKNRWAADDCSAFDILNTTYNLFAHIVLEAPVVIPREE